MESDASEAVVYVAIVIIILIYYIPAIIAFWRRHPNRWLIAVVNTAFGGSGIGWLGSLIWALQAVHISNLKNGSNGGESGLNLIANDVRKTEIVSQSDLGIELGRLHTLFEKEAITAEQYYALRDKIIKGQLTDK